MKFKMKYIIVGFITFLSMVGISACFFNSGSNLPDVKHLEEDIEWVRFEELLFSIDTSIVHEELQDLGEQYPAFFEIYFKNLLGLKPNDESVPFEEQVKGFLDDDRIVQLKDTTALVFQTMDAVDKDMKRAFSYLKYYFPNSKIPKLYTFISEYTIQLFLFSESDSIDGVGIGLDMFLGETYPYANIIPDNPSFSSYLTRTFSEKYLVKKVVESLVEDMMIQPQKDRLIDLMLYNGKKLYVLDHLLPKTQDEVIMEYTSDQLNWCLDNELEMWAYFFNEELFYETDINKINKLVNPSPHSTGMPKAAPGRTANYLGWKIVDAYMKRYPETTMTELFLMQDAQKLLQLSKFKPKRK